MPGPLVVVVTTGVEEYHTRILRGVHDVLSARGVSVVAVSSVACARDPSNETLPCSVVDLIRHSSCCGVIATKGVIPGEELALLGLLTELALPSVLVGLDVPGAASVRIDNTAGMRALMAHLLDECEVGRPVLVRGLAGHPDSTERECVFREELARRGIAVDEDLVVDGDFWHDRTYRAVRALLRDGAEPDAVVALNDLSAVGALRALTGAGRRVPEQVVVTGFDNERVSEVTWPGITTVDQDLEGQGAAAGTLLLRQLDGGPVEERVVLPSRLVLRGSTCGTHGTAERLEAAVTMSALTQSRLAGQDAILGTNRALLRCRSLGQVVDALAERLDHLGLGRCFLAIQDRLLDGGDIHAAPGGPVRLVLDFRGGRAHPPPSEPFPSHRLLPDALRGELGTGVLAVQALTAGDAEFGYVLFEQTGGQMTVSEMLHTDLSRTLEAIFGTLQLREHAAGLQQVIARRTDELKAEVDTRRRAQQDLQLANLELQRANDELRRSLMLDGLTRIANRSAFERHLDHHWRAQRDTGDELALLMVDVDLFKAYNDYYGHVRGDETLCTFAALLQQSVCDPSDLACRYGGEEFALVLPRSGHAAARAVAARFRALLAEAGIRHAASPVAGVVTASIGVAVATARPGTGPEWVVEAADRALYRAKALGRDRVAVDGVGEPLLP